MLKTFDVIPDAFIDQPPPSESGYNDRFEAADTTDAIKDACGAASRDFPKSLYIDPKDWADKARDNDKYHTWPFNYCDRFTNQNPSHSCTCHSLRTNFEIARNRQRGIIFPDGPKKEYRYDESKLYGSVWTSPLSVYAEANPREWGGANVRQVMEIAVKRGMLPDKIQPKDYGFKHTLQGTSGQGNMNQSGGDWVSMRNFPSGWEETAKMFKPLEVIFPGSYEEAICLVLNGYAVSVGRSGHAIPWTHWNVATQVMGYIDSYDVVRYDSYRTVKNAWGGSFAIATTTIPNDWSNPAAG